MKIAFGICSCMSHDNPQENCAVHSCLSLSILRSKLLSNFEDSEMSVIFPNLPHEKQLERILEKRFLELEEQKK